jgi:uncharacterized protein (TIGR02271 family)
MISKKKKETSLHGGESPLATADLVGDKAVVIALAEEHVQLSKRQVIKSKMNLHKTVEERLETVHIPLQTQTVEVVRIPKDELVTEALGVRQEGDTLILPIYEEVVVVEKRLRLVEEVHVVTTRAQREEVQEVLLRQEKASLEKDGEDVALKVEPH